MHREHVAIFVVYLNVKIKILSEMSDNTKNQCYSAGINKELLFNICFHIDLWHDTSMKVGKRILGDIHASMCISGLFCWESDV